MECIHESRPMLSEGLTLMSVQDCTTCIKKSYDHRKTNYKNIRVSLCYKTHIQSMYLKDSSITNETLEQNTF